MGLANSTSIVDFEKTMESWAIDLMLVAYFRDDADSYILKEAKLARDSWGKAAPLAVRRHLKNLCSKRTNRRAWMIYAHIHYQEQLKLAEMEKQDVPST